MRDPADTARTRSLFTDDPSDDAIVMRALCILSERIQKAGDLLNSPSNVRGYLKLRIATSECERFGVLWLDAQNRLIADDELFRGTLTETTVYPREVLKSCLQRNAAGAVLYHNHPSGEPEPSRADELLTRTLREALAMIDCRVLDHIIIAADRTTSFAERGLI